MKLDVSTTWERVARLAVSAALLAIVSGCGGESTTEEGQGNPMAGAGAGGSSGTGTGGSGGRGGSATGGSGGATGGTGGQGGGGGAAGGSGGDGASGGSAGGGSGGGGTGGSGGSGGSPGAKADKLDLLLMVDSSLSMDQKQPLFAQAMGYLLGRVTAELGISDIHVGIVTSSLGNHGGDLCVPSATTPERTYDDKAQLLPTVRLGLALESWNDAGFLAWDPEQAKSPPGEADLAAFSAAVGEHVVAAGPNGCGFEGVLESWYRFLIDPEPVESMSNDRSVNVRGAVNQVVLAQRAAFLRPDSAVVVAMLSDENDCSIVDENGTQGWLVAYIGGSSTNGWRMPRATSVCATNPNDPGCQPCTSGSTDAACAMGTLTAAEDNPNVRCFKQKQRFGVDLLYPIQRYVDGLTAPTIDPRYMNDQIQNPLFAGGRPAEHVLLLGIVGVPWQDLATPESLEGTSVDYLGANELADLGRWEMMLGEPENAVDPTDPLMIESIDARPTGAEHPLLGAEAAIVDATSTDSTANPINGHEQAIEEERFDLQYACIFPLATPIVCSMANEYNCECSAAEYRYNSPLCSYPAANMDGSQHYSKAYPGHRELSLLKRLGDRAVTTSICPRFVATDSDPATDPEYGYNPAMDALMEPLGEILGTP